MLTNDTLNIGLPILYVLPVWISQMQNGGILPFLALKVLTIQLKLLQLNIIDHQLSQSKKLFILKLEIILF